MAGGRPNVVWISLESVRADHTSLNGYDRETTPNLKRIAASDDGVSFSRCYAQSMWTPASTASILTGTHLFRHRVGIDEAENCVLEPELDTLPELLSESGYTTACLSTNAFLSDATGLSRGFDRFHWLRKSRSEIMGRETLPQVLKYLARVGTYGPGFTLDGRQHNLTYVLGELTRQTVTTLSGEEPYFLYVHPSNPHHPYAPPQKYRDKYFEDVELTAEEAVDLSLDVYKSQDSVKSQIANGPDLAEHEWEAIRALYDAEVSYVDEFVGWVFDHVRSTSGETIFVITGDHGDLFGEQGVVGHNLVLDDGLTHVPLVTHGLTDVDHNADQVVQHVDVTRTLASKLGVESEQFQGQNLTEPSDGIAVSQRGRIDLERYRSYNPSFQADRYHEAPLTAVRDERFKLLHSEDRTELVEPPHETTDVSDSYPEARNHLEDILQELLNEMGAATRDGNRRDAEFTDEMREQLSDLGYL